MNGQETMNLVRQLLTFVFSYATARGVVTSDQAQSLVTNAMVIIPALGTIASIGWSVYAHWNMKKVPENSVVVRKATPTTAALVLFMAAAASLFGFAHPAEAADMAVKSAPQFKPIGPYPNNGCGAYYGINAMTTAAPIQGAAVGATEIGGDIGGLIGYACASPTGPSVWFVEAIADFQNLNGSSNGLSLTGPAHLEQRAGFGGPLNNFLTSLPNLNLPALPALPGLPSGITAGPSIGYVYGALNEDDISASFGLSSARKWVLSPELGVGLLTRLSNNVVADTWAGIKLSSQGVCIGTGGCPRMSAGPVAAVSFKW